jgi:hypothetical protein
MAAVEPNVFESASAANAWAGKRVGGISAGALAAARASEPASEELVLHNIPYLAPSHPTTGSVSSPTLQDFETSCLLRADVAASMRARKPTPFASESTVGASAVEVRKVAVPITQRTARLDDKGMHARRQITRGEIILSEHPTLIFPSYLWLGALSQENANVYHMLVSRLPRADGDNAGSQAREFMALKNVKGNQVSKEEGIVRTNSISVDLSAEGDSYYAAVFLNIARCNHRCVMQL